MASISLEQAQSELPKIISSLKAGETILITDRGIPVARLSPEVRHFRKRRQPGSALGRLTVLSDDDDHLVDFADYMP
ncbi:MAG: hypothetical protein R3C49_20530 [Planctomycetaceae bacterium]